MKLEEVRRIANAINANLFKNSNSTAIGILKSHFKGSGLMFKEHQIYSHGDDVRFIDWKLLAKSCVPYIKTFEEERNIEISVVIDATPSMLTGYKGITKLKAAIEIACLLYLLCQKTNDYIHIFIVKDKILDIPKSSGEEGIIRLAEVLTKNHITDQSGNVIYEIDNFQPIQPKEIYRWLSKYLKKNQEIIFLSDFIDFLDEYHIKRFLRDKRIHCFRLLSPIEEFSEMPFRIFTKNAKEQSFQKTNTKTKKMIKNLFGKRMMFINVKDRYLEEFIRKIHQS